MSLYISVSVSEATVMKTVLKQLNKVTDYRITNGNTVHLIMFLTQHECKLLVFCVR